MSTEDDQEDFKHDVEAFVDICQRTYDCWLICRTIFHNEAAERCLPRHQAGHFLNWFNNVAIEYSLLQLAKLHDPATTRNSKNLSLNYMVEFGVWDKEKHQLISLRDEMKGLFDKIQPARHKLICHNDRSILVGNGGPLGAFESGLENTYFELLQEFVYIVQEKYLGNPSAFGMWAQGDAINFLKSIFPDYGKGQKCDGK